MPSPAGGLCAEGDEDDREPQRGCSRGSQRLVYPGVDEDGVEVEFDAWMHLSYVTSQTKLTCCLARIVVIVKLSH